jgi:drug/metabolite transporter (DMT)-like permease
MTHPTSTLRAPGAADFGLLLILALTWGSSFYFIKEAVETLPPLSLAVGRIAIGAAVLLIIARAKG